MKFDAIIIGEGGLLKENRADFDGLLKSFAKENPAFVRSGREKVQIRVAIIFESGNRISVGRSDARRIEDNVKRSARRSPDWR